MKNYRVIVLVACVAFLTLAAMPGHAQALIKVEVPFDFTVAHGLCPAGVYTITASTRGRFLVLSAGQHFIELFMWNTEESRPDIETAKLVFHRYGDHYFLAQIWSGVDGSVRKLIVSPQEKKLLAKYGAGPQIAVVYGLPVSPGGNN